MRRVVPWLTLAIILSCCDTAGLDGNVPPPKNSAEPVETESSISRVESGLLAQIDSENPLTRKRALAKLGLLYESEQRWAESAKMLMQAVEAYEELRPFLQIHLVDVFAELADWREAIRVAREIVVEHPDTSAATTARLRLPALLARIGETELASSAVDEFLNLRIDELTEAEFVMTADILAEEGLLGQASAIRERVIREYTRGRYTEKLYDQLTTIDDSPLAELSWSESLRLATDLERANRHEEARDFIRQIRARFPKRAGDPGLVWIEALSLFDSRRYTDLQQLSIPTGKAHHVGLERLKGHGLWRIDRNDEFLSTMRHILTDHAGSSEATVAKLLVGKYWLINGNDTEKAARYLDDAIRSGGIGARGENLWTLAWIYITSDQRTKALEVMNDYLRRFPDDSYTSNCLFWSAKLHEREGDLARRDELLERLIRMYPYGYYSYRAREILDRPPSAPDQIADGEVFPHVDAAEILERSPELVVVRELSAIGLEEEATRQYKEIVGSNPDDPALVWGLADRYASSGEPLRAIWLLQRTFGDFVRHGGREIPKRFWTILYPLYHWNEIQEAAEEQHVDPYLLAAIIRQESGWDPTIVSRSGAVGLMQVMPEEAAALGRLAGIGRVTREDLFDPLINLRVGASELREKLDAMDGHQMLAIASYNAGETAVRSWVRRTPPENRDLFIDSIPYSETRLYVMIVTRNLLEYRRIYGEANDGIARVSN